MAERFATKSVTNNQVKRAYICYNIRASFIRTNISKIVFLGV
jgi:hypothetical protein